MEVVFLRKFSKDLDKVRKPKDLNSIADIIELVKSADNLSELVGVKKLVGFEDAYRIRSGNYRIGVFVTGNTVEFARIAHRKDIYDLFP